MPSKKKCLVTCITILGRIPPDAVLNLMPEPDEVRALTLKQMDGNSTAIVCTSLGGEIVCIPVLALWRFLTVLPINV